MSLRLLLIALCLLMNGSLSYAAPGDLDPTFAGVGFRGLAGDGTTRAATYPGGKILVATPLAPSHPARISVHRLNVVGGLDVSLGGGGTVNIDVAPSSASPSGLLILPDEKALIATTGDVTLVRLTVTGDLDPTFGSGTGKASVPLESTGAGHSLARQADGRLLIVGRFGNDFAVARYNANGTIDTSFAGIGIATLQVSGSGEAAAVAVQPDGDILIAGESADGIVVARYFATGVLDPSFGTGGVVTAPLAGALQAGLADMAVRPDGKVLVLTGNGLPGTGATGTVAQLLSDGTADLGFGVSGIAEIALGGAGAVTTAHAIRLQGDGKAIVTGSTGVFVGDLDTYVARLDASGALDPTWGSGAGFVSNSLGGLELPSSISFSSYGLVVGGFRVNFGSPIPAVSAVVSRYEMDEFCGDGIVQAGEECDDGSSAAGDCCSPSCTFQPTGTTCNDDGDTCTVDTCDGAGSCEHATAPDGSLCDDGVSCTFGEICTAGACGNGVPTSCSDPLVCYKSKTTKGEESFDQVTGISVVDALESGSFDAKSTFELCVPATVNDVEPYATDVRQVAYRIKASSGEPKHVKQTGIVVEDHFGTHTLDTKKPDLLFVPAGLELGAPATAPGTALHYKCYKVKQTKGTPKFKHAKVTAADEFEDRFYDVFAPRRLCYAADKNGEGVLNPDALLTCYRLRRSHGQPPHQRVEDLIHTADQFGDLRLDTKKVQDVCLPASMVP